MCSFISATDRPAAAFACSISPAPLVWASDQSEEALLFQAEQIVASDEYSAEDKLAVYWRLLHIEKITDPELRATAQSSLGDLSRKCLDALTAQLAASPEEIDWIINRYRHFLQIRGIEDVERKKARWGLRRYLVRRWGKRALKAIRIAAVVLVAAYILWEVHGYYRGEADDPQFPCRTPPPWGIIGLPCRLPALAVVQHPATHSRYSAPAPDCAKWSAPSGPTTANLYRLVSGAVGECSPPPGKFFSGRFAANSRSNRSGQRHQSPNTTTKCGN